MNKKVLFITIVLTGCLFPAIRNIQAQADAGAQSAPAPVTATSRPAPGANRFQPMGSMSGPQSYRQTIMALRRAKLDLQHAKDTLNGHQQTAIEACDKAIEELECVVRTSGTNAPFRPQFASPPAAKPAAQ
jgi:hypothetical protein